MTRGWNVDQSVLAAAAAGGGSGVYRQMISKQENAHVVPGQEDVQLV